MSKSLENGIQALMFLATKRVAGVTEIAKALHFNKSTAYRIMETLKKFNFVEKNNQTSKYKIGPIVLKLAEHYYSNKLIVSVAKPFIQNLAKITGESIHLAVLANDSAVIVEQIMSDSRIVVNAKIGNAEPIQYSSVGKCLMAYLKKDDLDRILNVIVFKKYTEYSVKNREELIKQLETIRQQGYAIDNKEICEDIVCVAAPIFNSKGECTYSLGISGLASAMQGTHLKSIINNIKSTAASISYELGYSKKS
jgi:DNA-binding IclR family transcriptional regulator